MTAEIAIINRRAVTLAADSAVSIRSSTGEVKIFNSAEKIFELCSQHPIGLMIYNGVNLLQAPLEILAKDYRKKKQEERIEFARLPDCADDLLEFLRAFADLSPQQVKDTDIHEQVTGYFRRVNNAARSAYMRQQPGQNIRTPQELVREALQGEIAALQSIPPIESHKDLDWTAVYAFHKATIDQAAQDAAPVFPYDQADFALVTELAARALLSSEMSDNLTGLVVAGYGKDDFYPSLISYEIDGFVNGRLRCEKRNNVIIRAGEETVDIITFAQEDISRRLLDGVDPEIAEGMIESMYGHLAMMRQSVLGNVPAAQLQAVTTDWDAAATRFVDGIELALQTFIQKCNSEFWQTVAFMPKQEMAFFAEALVNTTAMKRKVSKDQEDVGGPVDVAVISKHDGFIWVKRKHYFDREHNPRYFGRVGGAA